MGQNRIKSDLDSILSKVAESVGTEKKAEEPTPSTSDIPTQDFVELLRKEASKDKDDKVPNAEQKTQEEIPKIASTDEQLVDDEDFSIIKEAVDWKQLGIILGGSAGSGALGVTLANKLQQIKNKKEDANIVRAGIIDGIRAGNIQADENSRIVNNINKTGANKYLKALPYMSIPATGALGYAIKRRINKKKDEAENKALYALGEIIGIRHTRGKK